MNFMIANSTKIIIVVVCIIAAVIGFLIKLASGSRHIDKELHFAFYFLAAAFVGWQRRFNAGKTSRWPGYDCEIKNAPLSFVKQLYLTLSN